MGKKTLDNQEIKLLKSGKFKDLFKSNFNKRIVIVLGTILIIFSFSVVVNISNGVYLEKMYRDDYIELLNVSEPYSRYIEATLKTTGSMSR